MQHQKQIVNEKDKSFKNGKFELKIKKIINPYSKSMHVFLD